MILKNHQINSLNEAKTVIGASQFLTESESEYYPEAVPIRETNDGYYMIKLEDLCEYALSNGIDDAYKAVSSVCESNDIYDKDRIIFGVDETSLLVDPELADTALAFVNEGATVGTLHISDNDPLAQLAEAVVEGMLYYEEMGDNTSSNSLIEAYVMDDVDTLLEADLTGMKEIGSNVKLKAYRAYNTVTGDANKALTNGFNSAKNTFNHIQGNVNKVIGNAQNRINGGINNAIKSVSDVKKGVSSRFERSLSRASREVDALTHRVRRVPTNSKMWAARKISALRSMKDKLINKFNTSASVNKAAVKEAIKQRYAAVIDKLDQGIKWLGSSF